MISTGKTVLITGVSGLLGSYLMKTIPQGWNAYGTWMTTMVLNGNYRMDITDRVTVSRVFDVVRPDIVIHCAAIGSVDYCQRHWQIAHDINVDGTKILLGEADLSGSKFVFISSNAVFDGETPPYAEERERNPVNVYGRLKAEAEDAVMGYSHDWMIIRPILLFGWPPAGARENWVTIALRAFHAGKELKVVDDIMTQPTYAYDCANTIWDLLVDNQTGIFHVAGDSRMSLYLLSKYAGKAFGYSSTELDCLVKAIASGDLGKSIAPRPRDTSYDLTKLWGLESVRKPSNAWDGLERMRGESSA
jgi:dTDP-4-dehydrorhamnose reductase